MATLEERIAKRQAKIEAEAARLKKDNARLREEERKRQTRRKMLLGEAILDAMTDDPDLKARVEGVLRKTLTKPEELKLFGLANLQEKPGDDNTQENASPVTHDESAAPALTREFSEA